MAVSDNPPHPMKKFCAKFAPALASVAMLSGCVLPMHYVAAPQSGKVLDSASKKPIHNATVSFVYFPKVSTKTDRKGRFYLPAASCWEITFLIGDYLPTSTLEVSAPDYELTRSFPHVGKNEHIREIFLNRAHASKCLKRNRR